MLQLNLKCLNSGPGSAQCFYVHKHCTWHQWSVASTLDSPVLCNYGDNTVLRSAKCNNFNGYFTMAEHWSFLIVLCMVYIIKLNFKKLPIHSCVWFLWWLLRMKHHALYPSPVEVARGWTLVPRGGSMEPGCSLGSGPAAFHRSPLTTRVFNYFIHTLHHNQRPVV